MDTGVLQFTESTGITLSRPSPGLYLSAADIETDIPIGAYIVSVDGVKIKTIEEWKAVLNAKSVGETVLIYYIAGTRDGTWGLTLTQRTDCDK